MNDVVAVFNGRKLIIPLKDNKPMHLLDLALIAQIEHSRIGMLLNPVAKDIFGDSSLSSTGDLFAEYLLRSIKIHQIASYCGYYNSMSPQRFDVQEVLQSAIYDQGLDISSMLYEVSPSHSEYLGMNNNINVSDNNCLLVKLLIAYDFLHLS